MLTGGIPAEYVGTPGLLSTVITKSGSNAFHGSGNYFFQNASLVAENKNSPNEEFSTFDAAVHHRRPGRPRSRVVLRQLPPQSSARTTSRPRYRRVHAHGRRTSRIRATPRARWTPTRNDTRELHVPQRSDRHQRPPRSRPDQRPRPGARAGRRQLQLQLLAPAGPDADRRRRQRAQRRGHGPLGDPRRRRTRSSIRSTDVRTLADEQLRRVRPGHHRPARHQGRARLGAVEPWNRHTIKGGLEWSRNDNFRDLRLRGRRRSHVAASPAWRD